MYRYWSIVKYANAGFELNQVLQVLTLRRSPRHTAPPAPALWQGDCGKSNHEQYHMLSMLGVKLNKYHAISRPHKREYEILCIPPVLSFVIMFPLQSSDLNSNPLPRYAWDRKRRSRRWRKLTQTRPFLDVLRFYSFLFPSKFDDLNIWSIYIYIIYIINIYIYIFTHT